MHSRDCNINSQYVYVFTSVVTTAIQSPSPAVGDVVEAQNLILIGLFYKLR